MRYQRAGMSFGFGSGLTPLGKKLLIIYAVIYVCELLLEHWFHKPIVYLLQLYPLAHPEFHVYQIFTHAFIHNPSAPISFLIDCLVFYFFSAPVEYAFGSKRFLILFYVSALGGAILGLIFSGVGGFNVPFMGMTASIISMVVIFGFLNPEATILLMFVLPIKAKYLSYGTILITFLTFLAKVNPAGAYHLGGILFGYIYFRGRGIMYDFQYWALRLQNWRHHKKRSRFTVVSGNKDDNDSPTIH